MQRTFITSSIAGMNRTKKIDRLWIVERAELKREIERYKRDFAEAKERLRIAEKVIEDKNRQPRK